MHELEPAGRETTFLYSVGSSRWARDDTPLELELNAIHQLLVPAFHIYKMIDKSNCIIGEFSPDLMPLSHSLSGQMRVPIMSSCMANSPTVSYLMMKPCMRMPIIPNWPDCEALYAGNNYT
jgi:hypothetical protein